MLDLSVVIVSWNVKEELKTNLKALFKTESDFNFEVIVVDNNSRDGSAEMVIKEFPEVKLIVNKENLGFSKANNQAIKISQGKYILLLNPDMELNPETLAKTLSWALSHPNATVTGIKLINQKGDLVKHVRRFPKLFDQLMIVLKFPHIFPFLLNSYLYRDFDYQKDNKVDTIRGAFFLINVENYKKLSGFDKPYLSEDYFIWFEEVDFCRNINSLGGEVWYTASAQCIDLVGQSFKQVKRGVTQTYFRDSMLKYFRKWGKSYEVKILSLAWRMVNSVVR